MKNSCTYHWVAEFYSFLDHFFHHSIHSKDERIFLQAFVYPLKEKADIEDRPVH